MSDPDKAIREALGEAEPRTDETAKAVDRAARRIAHSISTAGRYYPNERDDVYQRIASLETRLRILQKQNLALTIASAALLVAVVANLIRVVM